MSAISDRAAASAGSLAHELRRCRQRGLEGLDRDDLKLSRIAVPELEALASRYVGDAQHPAGRIPQIKTLLAAALTRYEEDGVAEDATLLTGLLFGDSVTTGAIRKQAGVLLRETRLRSGEPSEKLFREQFTTAFDRFAEYLI